MIAVLLGILACGGEEPAPAADGPPPARVVVAEVRADGLQDQWRTAAEVVALDAAELAAPVAGPVVAVSYRPGAAVSDGEVLLEIDRAPAAARLRRALAEAEAAQAQADATAARLGRAERVDESVMAAIELEELRAAQAAALARVAALEAAAEEARVELARHRIRAPFSGHLTERLVDPGDWVTPGQPVLSVVNTAEVEVHLNADATIAARLSEGAPVQIGDLEGEVVAVVPAIRADARTALVRISVAGEHGLKPGEAVSVELPLQFEAADGLLIPRDALVRDRGGDAVIRATGEDTAERLGIEVLASAEAWLMVTGPLAVGDRLVVRGNERLRPGQALIIAEADDGTR